MKNPRQTEDKIFQEIDRQVEELKAMIEEQYKNATMDEMELIVFRHVQGIGRSALESYYKKKNAELKDIKEIEVEEKKYRRDTRLHPKTYLTIFGIQESIIKTSKSKA